ncbi:MAG: hypothetical protein KKA19_01745, partial [Candidatus Margulisbacteria bacterium]|nr:hypothetical protein [Candidatus Margulisiibacteriota bacterium]
MLKSLILLLLCAGMVSAEVTPDVVVTDDILIYEDVSDNIIATGNEIFIQEDMSTMDSTSELEKMSTMDIFEKAEEVPLEQEVALPREGATPGQYPKLNIEGYKEYEFMKMEKAGDPLQYENDESYKKATAKILPTAGSSGLLRERLRLDIEGKLSEKLSVSYHLEQEPDLPDKFDIKVKYDKTELTFGDFDASFRTREFIDFNKAMNGFRLTSYDDWYDLQIVTAKERSTAKEVNFIGNGQTVYSLGQTSILEGSIKVYVNDLKMQEGVDYEVDYFEGKIIFKTIKSASDTIVVKYEFTDPIEDLIPVSTKVDFLGIQGAVRTFEEPRLEKSIINVNKSIQVEKAKPKTIEELPLWLVIEINISFNAQITTASVLLQCKAEFPKEILQIEIQYSPTQVMKIEAPQDGTTTWFGEIALPLNFWPKQAILVLYTKTAAFSRIIPIEVTSPENITENIVTSNISHEDTTDKKINNEELFNRAAQKGVVFENKAGTRLVVTPAKAEPGQTITFFIYTPEVWQGAGISWGTRP